MKTRLLALYLLLIKGTFSLNAQVTDTNFTLPPVITNSSIRNMELADSLSEAGDSINASRYFLKIDPYFFVSSGRTTETIDSSFANYLLTRKAKDDYRKIFAKAYNSERTDAYKVFNTMLIEDQAMRYKLSNCADSFSRNVIKQKVMRTDSPHFEYLYNYVKKNGWPTYENGSMYADIIALHDGKHMQYYLPYIKRSVIKGNSSTGFYYHILNRAKPSDMEKLRSYKQKVSFDISYVLKGYKASAAQIKEIQKAVLECGPIKYQYYVYESADKKDFDDFLSMSKNENYWLAWYILVKIEHAQYNHIPYDFLYSETNSKQKRLTVFLVY